MAVHLPSIHRQIERWRPMQTTKRAAPEHFYADRPASERHRLLRGLRRQAKPEELLGGSCLHPLRLLAQGLTIPLPSRRDAPGLGVKIKRRGGKRTPP